MSNILAPIVLFTYNRLGHTKKTIEALRNNTLANKSDIYIYSDGYKNDTDKIQVLEVRDFLKTIEGFKSVNVIYQDTNIGLANSIITGVTKIISQYKRVIVLEDDIVTSANFLTFMNDALELYKDENKVWNISGWNYPINTEHLESTFFTRVMNCWGWATWENRWTNFKKDCNHLINNFCEKDIINFNLDNANNFWIQVEQNHTGKINTWAVFWYATIFKNQGLCLNPAISYVQNIGFDRTGTNCIQTNSFDVTTNNKVIKLTKHQIISENIIAYERIKYFYLKLNTNSLNPNLIFSNKTRELFANINNLPQDKKYIIYGAGTGCDIILPHLPQPVSFIIDTDIKKKGTYKNSIPIATFKTVSNLNNYTIIISVFSHQDQIKKELIKNFSIDEKNIITLLK